MILTPSVVGIPTARVSWQLQSSQPTGHGFLKSLSPRCNVLQVHHPYWKCLYILVNLLKRDSRRSQDTDPKALLPSPPDHLKRKKDTIQDVWHCWWSVVSRYIPDLLITWSLLGLVRTFLERFRLPLRCPKNRMNEPPSLPLSAWKFRHLSFSNRRHMKWDN